MEIYTTQIPSMSPAALLRPVAVPVRTVSPATHVSRRVPSSVRSIVSDVPQVPQVDQVLAQAELAQILPVLDQPQAYGAIEAQGTGVSLVSSSNESLQARNGSAGSKGITGNKGTTVEMKRAFGGARGVPPRGRPV